MVYLLKFGAAWVLPPGIFFLGLWYVAWCLYKRREKRLAGMLAALVFVFYLCCTSLVSERIMGALEGAYVPPENPQGDVIIMLGGGAFPDTPDVSGRGTLCSSPANRLLTAVRLQRKLDVPIILSGGQVYSDSGPEAVIAKRILMDLGVPEDKIIVEGKSINTIQNAKFSTEIMRERGLQKPILVTSAFHMRRSVLNFAKNGVEVIAYPADYRTNRRHDFHYNKLKPSVGALDDNVTVLQEILRAMVTRYLE
ncbi:YdcF family protein [Selenomonas sp. AE3005]|uniref:YdcF family protein n=1 Tax=Selenomonas sp. AE3005 TaxID=1485543 RepID=UPI0025CE6424|nr:YdcF family protein [Selenomonas sp. AE3005]